MSFPIIRPGEVGMMPSRTVQQLRARLAAECHAAAVRHGDILATRRKAERASACLQAKSDLALGAAELRAECAAAAVRHRDILVARAVAAVPVDPHADEHAAGIDVDLPVPDAELQAARDRRRREARAERTAA